MKRILKTIALLMVMVPCVTAQTWINNAREKAGKRPPTFFEIQAEFDAFWVNRNHKIKGVGWKPFKRWEQFAADRLNQDGYVETFGLWNAWLEYQERYADSEQNPKKASWTALGPGPQLAEPGNGTGYRVLGGAGRVNCIAFHPTNANIIYVGSPAGGAWKSTNGGSSWAYLSEFLPNLGVSSIVVDHNNPNTVYMATGDADSNGQQGTYSIGVLKSLDGGQSWSTTGLSLTENQQLRVAKLVMHPTNPNILLAATNFGLYRTQDGAASWHPLVDQLVISDIEVDPTFPDYWYASVWGQGIIWSGDGGDTWNAAGGLPPAGSGYGRVELTICPADTYVLYAVAAIESQTASNGGLFGVYRSTDGGFNWELVHAPNMESGWPNLLGWYDGLNFGGQPDVAGQGHYDLTIAVHPTDPNTVYVGGVNIWRTTDAGANWSLASYWLDQDQNFSQPYTHADQHAMVYAPDNTLHIGNDGGIFKLSGGSWTDLSEGLNIHQIDRASVAQTRPDMTTIGAQDNGSARYLAGQWRQMIGGDGLETLIDYSNENIVYASTYNGFHNRSVDGGLTFTQINVPDQGAWATPLIQDPNDPNGLFRATSIVQYSPDRGDSWFQASPQISGYPLGSMAVAPSNSNVVYVADLSYNQQSQVFARTLDGQNWEPASSPTGVTRIAVHPTDPHQVAVTVSGFRAGEKVFYSNDAGSTWSNISGSLPNMPANCIIFDPDRPQDLYVGTELGVFVSASGADWVPFNDGLPMVIVRDLEIQQSARILRAATYGRGLWETPLPGAGGGGTVTPDPNTRWLPHITKLGGLFQTSFTLSNQSANAGSITLHPYDSAGNRLAEKTYNLAPWQFQSFTTTSQFPGVDVSHISISGDKTVVVTAAYRIASGPGATAHVNETSHRGNTFTIYPGEWDTIFDGMALVNLSTSPADINAVQYSKQGKVLSEIHLKDSLAPYAKTLAVFGSDFPSIPGSIIQVTSSQPAAVTFLRGSYPGSTKAYLYQTVPVLDKATSSQRWLTHITPPNAAFTSTLFFTNSGSGSASMTLTPYASNGTVGSPQTLSVSGNSFQVMDATQLFGGANVSHCRIEGPNTCVVTIGYKIGQGAGATAHVNETQFTSGLESQNFFLYQGEWDTIFDGMAIVNLGNGPAEIAGYQYDTSGNQTFGQILNPNLAANAKHLLVFDSVFPNRPDQQIYLTSNQPAMVIFLRGTPPGVSPGYLYQTVPVPLSAP